MRKINTAASPKIASRSKLDSSVQEHCDKVDNASECFDLKLVTSDLIQENFDHKTEPPV